MDIICSFEAHGFVTYRAVLPGQSRANMSHAERVSILLSGLPGRTEYSSGRLDFLVCKLHVVCLENEVSCNKQLRMVDACVVSASMIAYKLC